MLDSPNYGSLDRFAFEPRRVDKPWGWELIWAHADAYVGKVLFVRADWLPGLSEAGRQALVEYGVSLVVDLRPDREHEADEISPLPVPIVRQGMDPRPLQPAWDWPSMREAYLALADHYRAELAQA